MVTPLWMLILRSSLGHRALVCGLCFLLSTLPAFADDLPMIDMAESASRNLAGQAQFLSRDSDLPFEQVQQLSFAPFTSRDINQGISEKIYWLRYRITNTGDEPLRWTVGNDTSYLDHLVVYTRDGHPTRAVDDGHTSDTSAPDSLSNHADASSFTRLHLTDREPFQNRQTPYRYLTFTHETPADGYTDVYVKTYYSKADSMSLNFTLWQEDAFWQNARHENILYGGYFGMLLILIIISLTFAILLRQKNALYYAAFLTGTGLLWLMLNGYGFQYLWPNAVYWHNEGFHISFLLYALLGLQFSKTFLRTHSSQPALHKLFTTLQIIAVGGVLLRALGNYNLVLDLAFAMLFMLALIIPVASWRAWRKGLGYARWFTMAWLLYSVALTLAVVSAYSNAMQSGMEVLGYMQVGSLLEAVFLMAAMSEWLLSLESDRRKAIALANQDPLTGLGNRRLLQLQYEAFVEQFRKRKQPVFLIMMDLDFFKQVNDTYGHEAGDHVLKAVAKLIEKLSREGDICVRYGGEEFAILLRADTIEAVWQVAERIRVQFSQHPTAYNGLLIEHTLSSGIAQVLSEKEMLSVSEMMARADAALYRGKSSGRNCTTIYRPETPTDDDSFPTLTTAST